VEFDVSEYTLAFCRVLGHVGTMAGRDEARGRWMLLRPVPGGAARRTHPLSSGLAASGEVAEVFIVPLCSTLALDDRSYEWFLLQSSVLDDALELLAAADPAEPNAVETIRKEIQSLVMKAEVEHIVDSMPA
jgi:hypothetical protein